MKKKNFLYRDAYKLFGILFYLILIKNIFDLVGGIIYVLKESESYFQNITVVDWIWNNLAYRVADIIFVLMFALYLYNLKHRKDILLYVAFGFKILYELFYTFKIFEATEISARSIFMHFFGIVAYAMALLLVINVGRKKLYKYNRIILLLVGLYFCINAFRSAIYLFEDISFILGYIDLMIMYLPEYLSNIIYPLLVTFVFFAGVYESDERFLKMWKFLEKHSGKKERLLNKVKLINALKNNEPTLNAPKEKAESKAIEEQITEINFQLESGEITQEEYDKKRKSIIDSI